MQAVRPSSSVDDFSGKIMKKHMENRMILFEWFEMIKGNVGSFEATRTWILIFSSMTSST